jgi:hypothetical protein
MMKGALILSESQWNDILKWIPNNEQYEQEKRILKYLQEASAAMKAKWPENNKVREAKKVRQTTNPDIARYEAIKKADSAKRRELIEEAERFVNSRKIKECPIDLRSAAILSENLAGRKIQLDFQAARRSEEKEKNLMVNKLDMAQSIAWLNDGYEHRMNAYGIAKQHKKELLDSITQRRNERIAEKSTRIAEEKKIIEQHFKNIDDKKVRDRKLKEEQCALMRRNEISTVLMAKQKREDMKRENEVIDVLAKVHNEGRNNIKQLIKNQENQAKFEKIKLDAKLFEMGKVRHNEEIEKLLKEQELIENARLEKEKILDAIEERANDRKKFLKDDRMQDYEKSLKAAEERKAREKEEDKEYHKNRIVNDVVSLEYKKTKKELKEKRTKENLDFVKNQAKEIRLSNRKERQDEIRQINKKFEDDTTDQRFFDYAQDLLDDAYKKNRPLKPIFQVVKAYKNRHFIDVVKRTRPHEISNVPLGVPGLPPGDKGKTRRRQKLEREEARMTNAYRSTKFINVD